MYTREYIYETLKQQLGWIQSSFLGNNVDMSILENREQRVKLIYINLGENDLCKNRLFAIQMELISEKESLTVPIKAGEWLISQHSLQCNSKRFNEIVFKDIWIKNLFFKFRTLKKLSALVVNRDVKWREENIPQDLINYLNNKEY